MKNVLSIINLYKDKNKRAMHKAGWLDDNGNLTETGKSVYLNYKIDNKEDLQAMGELARTVVKEKVDESSEED